MKEKTHEEILKRMFVDSGEYSFENKEKAQRFISKVLLHAEDLYSDEHYYREYNDFEDFLYTDRVDGIAYFVYEGEYGHY